MMIKGSRAIAGSPAASNSSCRSSHFRTGPSVENLGSSAFYLTTHVVHMCRSRLAVNHLSSNIAYYFLGAEILACFNRRMRAASSLAAQVGGPGWNDQLLLSDLACMLQTSSSPEMVFLSCMRTPYINLQLMRSTRSKFVILSGASVRSKVESDIEAKKLA